MDWEIKTEHKLKVKVDMEIAGIHLSARLYIFI